MVCLNFTGFVSYKLTNVFQFGERLAEEAEVLRSLTHPNIIQYKGWKPGGDGIHALMMEHGHRSLQVLLIAAITRFLEGTFGQHLVEVGLLSYFKLNV